MSKSQLEEQFALQVRAIGLPEPVREFKFHETRKWKIDFAWPALKLAVELEGGIWTGGRHTSGAGWIKDAEKYNELSLMGWRLLRYHGGAVKDGSAIRQVEVAVRLLEKFGGEAA